MAEQIKLDNFIKEKLKWKKDDVKKKYLDKNNKW